MAKVEITGAPANYPVPFFRGMDMDMTKYAIMDGSTPRSIYSVTSAAHGIPDQSFSSPMKQLSSSSCVAFQGFDGNLVEASPTGTVSYYALADDGSKASAVRTINPRSLAANGTCFAACSVNDYGDFFLYRLSGSKICVVRYLKDGSLKLIYEAPDDVSYKSYKMVADPSGNTLGIFFISGNSVVLRTLLTDPKQNENPHGPISVLSKDLGYPPEMLSNPYSCWERYISGLSENSYLVYGVGWIGKSSSEIKTGVTEFRFDRSSGSTTHQIISRVPPSNIFTNTTGRINSFGIVNLRGTGQGSFSLYGYYLDGASGKWYVFCHGSTSKAWELNAMLGTSLAGNGVVGIWPADAGRCGIAYTEGDILRIGYIQASPGGIIPLRNEANVSASSYYLDSYGIFLCATQSGNKRILVIYYQRYLSFGYLMFPLNITQVAGLSGNEITKTQKWVS